MSKKEVKFPPQALLKAQQLFQQKAIADMQFQIYVQGVFDSLGLDGNWNLDTNTWIISQLSEKPKEPDIPKLEESRK